MNDRNFEVALIAFLFLLAVVALWAAGPEDLERWYINCGGDW
jgi:hypothetical protein